MKNISQIINKTNTLTINTPIGKLGIRYDDKYIYKVYFENEIDFVENYKQNHLSEIIKTQFDKYFSGNKMDFNLPTNLLNVREFTKECLLLVKKISIGDTISYKGVATLLNKPNAARAVGNVMNKNPIPLIIPCHRVVGNAFKYETYKGLVGYRGGLEIKKWLLNFEKNIVKKQ